MSSLDVDRSVTRINNRSYYPSTSLTHPHIADALVRSQDNGATLVFMKKHLTDIGQEAAEELATIGMEAPEDESCVERIALGNNHLTTLPMEFALLSRLRYLNLKNNNFTVFPDVLTLMRSLDTLDISHNKIKRLPSQPGDLVNLRVFCFARNKVARLPTYFSRFHKLAVLEADHNPIEWPPKSVMERPTTFSNPEAMKDWIKNVQRWIEVESLRSLRAHDNSGYSEQTELESKLEDSFNSWSKFPSSESDLDEGVTPHARSFSIDSTLSSSSIAESDIETPSSSYDQIDPPPLRLGMLQPYSPEISPTRSFDSYLPSPAESDTFFDDNATASPRRNGSLEQQQHTRNASFAAELYRNSARTELHGKKSLPDLRTAKLNFTKKLPELPDRANVTPMPSSRGKSTNDEFSMPSPMSQRQDSSSSMSSGPRATQNSSTKDAPLPSLTHSSPTRVVPHMAFERNSYFRRLSTLPTPTSNTLPRPLLCLIDSARTILFAVCQIYQSLEHYTIYAIDDRLSSVLRKVLDPASADMMQLINSLDRFDVLSRKALPPPSVCRSVAESCKDTVIAFSKAVSVLQLQLKVIASGDDVRYLRSMLLVLYAAAAEISCAWQNMIPQIEAVKPFLHSKPFASPSPSLLTGIDYSTSWQSTKPFQLEHTPQSASSLRTNIGAVRSHTARRHAGSFSYRDVEIGKTLPSYEEPILASRGIASTTALRSSKRQAIASVTIGSPVPPSPQPLNTSASTSSVIESSLVNHSRSGSQASLQASSTSSSPSIPAKAPFLELPPSSKTQVDKEAIHAVRKAVDVAPIVWNMMEDLLENILDSKPEVRETLEKAKLVTNRLSESIRAVKDGDLAAERRNIRDDAHVFLKSVVQLSNVLKTYGAPSPVLRTNMVKLTNSTEEFAILLHVSSFSPSGARPYSPLVGASASQTSLQIGDETRPVHGLSRSRSAQASTNTGSPVTHQDMPRSAQPFSLHSFKVPAVKRYWEREARSEGNDPG